MGQVLPDGVLFRNARFRRELRPDRHIATSVDQCASAVRQARPAASERSVAPPPTPSSFPGKIRLGGQRTQRPNVIVSYEP